MIVDILFLAESNMNRIISYGKYFCLKWSYDTPHLLMNLSIAFSVAADSSAVPMVLQDTA